jgi:tetratricopeptide (TPR) repeat protein
VKPADWPRVVWWSFYEGDASFDNFLVKTLDYLSGGKIKLTTPTTEHLLALLQILQQPGTLLVLDGFERALRAFGGLDAAYQGDEAKAKGSDRDCISPLAENFLLNVAALPDIRSRVLLTTRLTPRVLEPRGGGLLQGCCEEELKQMRPDDAIKFFMAQGVRGTRAEIEQACEPYGYHPLSLRLLAGLIVGDYEQPGDISVAERLDVSGNLIQRQHHVLEVAYDSLTPERKGLLSRIACFRGPVKYDALKALAATEKKSPATLDSDLRDLVTRGLLHHDAKERRFDLHPIVRRYAYDRLAAPDRAAAHTRLRDYFSAVPTPDKVTSLEDLSPVIELYHHTVRAGQYDEAFRLFRDRLHTPAYYQFGAYQLCIDLLSALFPDGEDHPPRLKEKSAQAWTLVALANSYGLSGQPQHTVPLFERVNAIYDKLGNKGYLAVSLGNMATQQMMIGALRDAEANLRQLTALSEEIKDEPSEAIGHMELGWLLAYRGTYAESDTELGTAFKTFEKQKEAQPLCLVLAYRALRDMLRLRSNPGSASHISQSALKSARRALELADEDARTVSPVERDYVRAHWLLGAAHRVAGQTEEAEHHLHEALERCRRINMVDHEANILIDIARLRAATGALDEARRLAEEALLITERSGYVLQGADAHLELTKLALADNDKTTAKKHARQARDLATCDGPPDYTYKAAYDEAGALLDKLKS